MSTHLEDRLRRYGDTFERALDTAPIHVVPVAPLRPRGGGPVRWLVAASILGLVVVAMVLGLRSNGDDSAHVVTNEPPATTRYTDRVIGFSVEYPSSWRRATTPLVSTVWGSKEILSLGTYPMRPGGAGCTEWPGNALEDLPAGGALVSVQGSDDPVFYGPRPTFPPSDAEYARLAKLAGPTSCTDGANYEHWWFPFDENGRTFYVLVAFGAEASPTTKMDAWAIVNSMGIDPFTPMAIPNHVSDSLYSTQEGSPTAIVKLSDGPYETVVRVGDSICIDLRPSGAPTGPRFCGIPARSAWPTPAIAATVELDGTRYFIGVASEDVISVGIAGDDSIRFDLIGRRQPFPTLQFFAVAVPGNAPLTLRVSTRTIGDVMVNVTAAN